MIGQKIKNLRVSKDLTQDDLAIKLYVSRQTISRWENEKTIPTMENLIQLSSFFSLSVNYFTEIEDVEYSKNEGSILTSNNEKKGKNRYVFVVLYLFLAIAPFFNIWSVPFSIYSFIFSQKKEVKHHTFIRIVALTSILFFLLQLLLYIVGLFNLNSSTTEVFIN